MIKIFRLKNIISVKDFEREDIEYILNEASKLENIAKSREISETFGYAFQKKWESISEIICKTGIILLPINASIDSSAKEYLIKSISRS